MHFLTESFIILAAVERTKCVNMLQGNVTRLLDSDLKLLADQFLKNLCVDNSVHCTNGRHLIIDVIARVRSDVSQQIIIKHVLNNSDATEEELRHALIHSMNYEIPTPVSTCSIWWMAFLYIVLTYIKVCLNFGLKTNINLSLFIRTLSPLFTGAYSSRWFFVFFEESQTRWFSIIILYYFESVFCIYRNVLNNFISSIIFWRLIRRCIWFNAVYYIWY